MIQHVPNSHSIDITNLDKPNGDDFWAKLFLLTGRANFFKLLLQVRRWREGGREEAVETRDEAVLCGGKDKLGNIMHTLVVGVT